MFDVLIDLFNRIGLCTKLRKTMSIAFQTCHTPAELLEAAYEQWVTGIGKSYQERLRSWVQCLKCGVYLVVGFLLVQLQS